MKVSDMIGLALSRLGPQAADSPDDARGHHRRGLGRCPGQRSMPWLIGLFPSGSRASGLFTSIVRRFCRLRGGSLANWFECLANPVPSKDNCPEASSTGLTPEPGISWLRRSPCDCCHPRGAYVPS